MAFAQTDGSQQWAYTLGGFASASPALSADGQTIYIGVEGRTSGLVLAVPRNGGVPRWTITLPDSVSSSAAVGNDGTVYVGCENGLLYALNPANGQVKWFVDTRTFVASSPALGADGTIYFGAGDSQLYAVNPDGTVRWKFAASDWILSSPAIGLDGTIYFGSNDGFVYAVAPDGGERWRFRTGAGVETSPAIGIDGTIYVGSRDQKMYALAPDGAKKWELFTNDAILASPSLGADGTIYFASMDRNFYAVRPADGTVRWKTDYGSTSLSTAAIRSDGVVVFGADDGLVRALNPNDGSIRWRFDTRAQLGDFIESSPIIAADGAIYIASLDGHLYKLNGNGSSLSAQSSWPAFRRDARHTARAVTNRNGGQLANLATRAQAGGTNNLVAGFVVQGALEKAYLIRAVGPGLAKVGINGFLPDPRLDLYSGRLPLHSNDNWGEGDTLFGIADVAAGVGAFPLDPGSKDAAIVFPLPPGSFTAHVNATDAGHGVALVEVYDARGGDNTARLVNLSTRGQVGTGENILIAGLVVGGTGSMRLLLRGIGPALAQFGVPGVLAAPRMEVFRGTLSLGANTGWSNNANRGDIAGAAVTVAAFPLPENSADAALLLDATAGEYTIQISGVGGATGEAMVEIYVVP